MSDKKRTRRQPVTFDEARAIALSMPEVEETTAYGMPAFKAGKTRFAGRPVERADVEPGSLGVMIDFEQRNALLASRPDVFYLTDHYAPYPAVLVRLEKISRADLTEILTTAWRQAMERQTTGKTKRSRAAKPSKPRRRLQGSRNR